ncbi:MAG: serine hydrolase domain-containing protein [Alphaproteobacteria bacterium]
MKLALVMFLAALSGTQVFAAPNRAGQVETGLRAPVAVAGEAPRTYRLADRMRHYAVPGVSIAVIDRGRIAWAKGYGEAQRGRRIERFTRFQAGSISKPVAAVAAMKLVVAGRLSLDDDINSILRSWRLPRAPSAGDAPVTLRQLLSHSAGIGVHAFYPGYEPGVPLPTPLEILDGKPPAANPPIRVENPPGRAFDYSGGGYQVTQQLLTDVTGAAFSELVQKLVFRPLGMRSSSFVQVSPSQATQHHASGHDRDGKELPQKWYLHPELAAAGLWSTPSDLARLGLALTRDWKNRRALLGREGASQLLSPQQGGWGLGFQVEGTGRAFRFRHGGDNPGYKAVMVIFPESEQGAVIMTNGDRGDRLADELLYSIAAAYGWPDFAPKTKVRLPVSPAELERVAGIYALDSDPSTRIVVAPAGSHLSFTLIQASGRSSVEFLPAGPGRYFRRDIDFDLQFSSEVPARKVTLVQDGESFTASRTSN